jgi:hypothetical protein
MAVSGNCCWEDDGNVNVDQGFVGIVLIPNRIDASRVDVRKMDKGVSGRRSSGLVD